ncbi:MAG: ATP-binding cassette domain-containing protein [Lachnospiraceae bacterium]|nr:ATP-binding cassette domain-containing protein [Lachnospiraceae bacterium]
MSEKIIEIRQLNKKFVSEKGEVAALTDVSLEIEKKDIYGIIGLSGAGKSTLVRCMNLLERPSSGEVIVNGKSLTELSDRQLRTERRKIGMIFQHFNLLMQRSVVDNVAFPLEISGHRKKDARKKALEYLEAVGLTEKANAYPAQLSGGQKQRVAIARVLASKPEILLCDEATSALDPQTTKSILSLLKEINEKYGITIVVITHEMSVIQEICDHVAVLEHGKLVESGTTEQLFRSPKTAEARRLVFSGSEHILEMTSERVVRISFHGGSAYEPTLGNIVLETKTPVNILYANTQTVNGEAEGEMLIQLPADNDKADRIVEYFREKGLDPEEVKEYAESAGNTDDN